METLGSVCFGEKEESGVAQGQFDGSMAVITQGGNELMYSYNNVTQSLLRKVCTLQEKLKEKETEILRVKCENERLLERIHELILGAELREEAKEYKIRSKTNIGSKKFIKFEIREDSSIPGKKRGKKGQSSIASFFKATCLLGITIGTTVYFKENFDI